MEYSNKKEKNELYANIIIALVLLVGAVWFLTQWKSVSAETVPPASNSTNSTNQDLDVPPAFNSSNVSNVSAPQASNSSNISNTVVPPASNSTNISDISVPPASNSTNSSDPNLDVPPASNSSNSSSVFVPPASNSNNVSDTVVPKASNSDNISFPVPPASNSSNTSVAVPPASNSDNISIDHVPKASNSDNISIDHVPKASNSNNISAEVSVAPVSSGGGRGGSNGPPGGGGGGGGGGIFTQGLAGNASSVTSSVVKTSTTCKAYLNDYLSSTAKNNLAEVTKLQKFLQGQGFVVDVNGVYDSKTIQAVSKFQLKYADDILKRSWNISVPTGQVYVATRLKINNLVCGKSNDSSSFSYLGNNKFLAQKKETVTPIIALGNTPPTSSVTISNSEKKITPVQSTTVTLVQGSSTFPANQRATVGGAISGLWNQIGSWFRSIFQGKK